MRETHIKLIQNTIINKVYAMAEGQDFNNWYKYFIRSDSIYEVPILLV